MGLKWARLVPNGTKPGLIQIRFQYILARWCTEIWSDKVPVFVEPRCNVIWSLKSPGFDQSDQLRAQIWHPRIQTLTSWRVCHWWQLSATQRSTQQFHRKLLAQVIPQTLDKWTATGEEETSGGRVLSHSDRILQVGHVRHRWDVSHLWTKSTKTPLFEWSKYKMYNSYWEVWKIFRSHTWQDIYDLNICLFSWIVRLII